MPSVEPQLPSHLTVKRKRDEEGDSASKRPRVIGPAHPPAPLDEHPPASPTDDDREQKEADSDSSDDDEFGPSLPAAAEQKNAITRPQPQAAPAPAPTKRDEWMTIAPSSGDWSARVDPTKLKNRKFGTGKGPSSTGAGADSWHETPEQKQARLQREMMGIKDESSRAKPSRTTETPEDEATRKRIREYNEARGPSLYQAHQNQTQQEKEDDPSSRAFDREKDIGGGLQINSTQRRGMMKASDFGSRFSSAKYL
jgi:Protein of unknown function (DUF3752)